MCALLSIPMLTLTADAQAQRQTERSRQKVAAEKQRAGIQQQLAEIKRDISRTESEKEDAADTLAESEAAISNANRALRELADEQEATQARLLDLDTQQQRLSQTIQAQQKQLSRMLREHYVAGNEDRIKLLLSGDNPNRISRDLQLMGYVSQAQARLLASLRTNLATVDANREQVENAQLELEEIAQEQRDQKALLVKEKARRAALLANLSDRLATQRKQADRLQRDEQRMTGLVDQLTRLIRQQAEAEKRRQAALAAAREKAAREKAARDLAAAQKAERERLARQQAASSKSGQEPKVAQQAAPKPAPQPVSKAAPDRAAEQPAPMLGAAAPAGAFAALKGRLSTPVHGSVAARFGTRRGDGPSWKGTFIKAAEGTQVHAVGPGRVVHADWMRGFGNLIIIDHGGEYLSIYGNNQALLKRPGDMVRAGEVIASAGNTGGNEESGLYFELRHRGKAFDPAGWVNF